MAVHYHFDAIDPDPNHLNGDIHVHVLDKDQNPNQVLETDLDWAVKVDWSIFGPDAPAIGGDWHIKVFVESMGPGPEKKIGEKDVPVSAAAPSLDRHYTTKINMPAGTIATDGHEDGVYKLVTVITHSNSGAGITKLDKMAAFAQEPLLQFYTPQV